MGVLTFLNFRKSTGKELVWGINFASGISFTLFGYDNGVIGGILTQTSFLEAMNFPSAQMTGLIVSVYYLGCFLGCVGAACFGFKMGRKSTIHLGSLFVVVGATIQASAFSSAQIMVGRIVAGMGTGLSTSTIPTWVSETCAAGERGALVAFQLAIVSFGILIAYWLDYGMALNQTGQVVWRFPIAFQMVFALGTMVMLAFLPESPRWLYAKGRIADGDQVLGRLKNGLSQERIDYEKEEILAAIELERSSEIKLSHLVWDKSPLRIHRRIATGMICQWLQQFTGIGVIITYIPLIVRDQIGTSENLALVLGGVAATIYFVASFPPMWFIERIGRRWCLLLGSGSMAICWILFMVMLEAAGQGGKYAALVFIYLFQIAFAFSWLACAWVVPSEISPLCVRHIGSALATSCEWLAAFVITMVTPPALANIGWKFFIIFAVACIIQIPLVYLFLPETAGLTLEEIDIAFTDASIKNVIRSSRKKNNTDIESSERHTKLMKSRIQHNEKLDAGNSTKNSE